ncbi:MAG: hypothetical protein PHF86_03430 [Candidatus Nanoarchaeia archaeon]|jgi:hypothetical protein|nr:hypothetical protein [Candidatus Nanoarchaeia archaeon]
MNQKIVVGNSTDLLKKLVKTPSLTKNSLNVVLSNDISLKKNIQDLLDLQFDNLVVKNLHITFDVHQENESHVTT